jgi:hypothetical protein
MICSVKFGFSQKAALKDLEGRGFPTPGLNKYACCFNGKPRRLGFNNGSFIFPLHVLSM